MSNEYLLFAEKTDKTGCSGYLNGFFQVLGVRRRKDDTDPATEMETRGSVDGGAGDLFGSEVIVDGKRMTAGFKDGDRVHISP